MSNHVPERDTEATHIPLSNSACSAVETAQWAVPDITPTYTIRWTYAGTATAAGTATDSRWIACGRYYQRRSHATSRADYHVR